MSNNPRNPRVSAGLTPPIVAHPTGGRTALAEGAAAIGQTVASLRVENITSNLTSELEAASQEAIAKMQQEAGNDLFEGLPDADRTVVQNFTDMNNRLVTASEQAPDRISELKMRQERILRDYMRRYPRLVPQFQQAAHGTLGYSPIGAEIAALQRTQAAQQSELKKIFDQVVDGALKAGVSPERRLTDPSGFFQKGMEFLRAEEQLAASQRELALMETRGKARSIQGRNMLRRDMPSAMRAAVPDVMEAVGEIRQHATAMNKQLSTMSPQEVRAFMESGESLQLMAALRQQREDMITGFQQTYFAGSDMTREEITKEIAPLLTMWDFAIENFNDSKLSERMGQLISVRENSLAHSLPDSLVKVKLLGEYLDSTVYSGLFANQLLQQHAVELIEPILLSMLGGQDKTGRTTTVTDDDGTYNPLADHNRLPLLDELRSDNPEATFRDLSKLARNAVRAGISGAQRTSDEEERLTHLFNAGNLANQYANTYMLEWQRNNQLLDQTDVFEWVDLIGNPSMEPVWKAYHAAGHPPGGVAASIERMLASESATQFQEIGTTIAKSMGITHKDPVTGATELMDLVTVEWDKLHNRPQFVLDTETWDKLSTYGYQKPEPLPAEAPKVLRALDWINRVTSPGKSKLAVKRDMERAVEELNQSANLRYFAALVRANANLSPLYKDYEQVALDMVKEYRR